MQVKINGKIQKLNKITSLYEFIMEKKLDLNKIVIERNYDIVDKNKLSDISINEGDIIEIISFVGGG
ncbi:MAG: sulfur carrier protein ThiS [Candidatus Omnitrophica bacterium]|jgi:sulfur carrier protein|nr:sulfur carrier protein ThiS [Candidatus Omnitrophota bacterium]